MATWMKNRVAWMDSQLGGPVGIYRHVYGHACEHAPRLVCRHDYRNVFSTLLWNMCTGNGIRMCINGCAHSIDTCMGMCQQMRKKNKFGSALPRAGPIVLPGRLGARSGVGA